MSAHTNDAATSGSSYSGNQLKELVSRCIHTLEDETTRGRLAGVMRPGYASELTGLSSEQLNNAIDGIGAQERNTLGDRIVAGLHLVDAPWDSVRRWSGEPKVVFVAGGSEAVDTTSRTVHAAEPPLRLSITDIRIGNHLQTDEPFVRVALHLSAPLRGRLAVHILQHPTRFYFGVANAGIDVEGTARDVNLGNLIRVRYAEHGEYSRVVFDVQGSPELRGDFLHESNILYFDIIGVGSAQVEATDISVRGTEFLASYE